MKGKYAQKKSPHAQNKIGHIGHQQNKKNMKTSFINKHQIIKKTIKILKNKNTNITNINHN